MEKTKIKPFDSKKLLEEINKSKKEGKNSEEDIKESEEKEEKESLEELTEEYEEPNFRLQHFLANQHRDVSFEKINETPLSSLEDLPPVKKEEDEEEKIEYMIKNEFEAGRYQTISSDTKFENPNISNENLSLKLQKTMYRKAHELSEDFSREIQGGMNPEIKYIKPEDTQKKDSLMKKTFGSV